MKTKIALLSTVAILGMSTALFAQTTPGKDTKWQQQHPRREQVNNRLSNQNARVNDAVEDHDMSKREAKKIHREDRQIRREERHMAAQNGGHITRQEQKVLNRQENRVSRQIKRHS